MYQGIRNSLTGVDAINLIEAAQVLGVSKLYAFFRIIVPNILPGITVSAMLSMAIIFGDFAIVNTLAGSIIKRHKFIFKRCYSNRGNFQVLQ